MVRVMVVEDAEAIRHVLEVWLTQQGCQVFPVGDGQAALELMQRQDVDLLIADYQLPGMNGWNVIQAAFVHCPSLRRAVLMSGFVEVRKLGETLEDPRVTLIPKPFRPSQLEAEVERLATGGVQVSDRPPTWPGGPMRPGSIAGVGE